jgi:hypothetical protein
MFVGDARLQMTHEKQLARAQVVAANPTADNAKKEGCHGPSAVIESVPYGNYGMFMVSTCHAILYGLVKKFLGYSLRTKGDGDNGPCISPANRKVLEERLQHIHTPHDYGRNPK